MPKIIQLSSHVANLIAAGEVVERPASVVKELLENSVDAGASQITIEIRDGGMTFLRITDNGCGMSPEDAKTAFLRHATSKLRNAEDLASIGTMGFRGEALAAIASVSRIDLLTKTPGAISGTALSLESGNIIDENEAGCPDGTTIIVRDLFFNTPARMKFMKSDTVEGARVAGAVQLQALAHPEVAFRFLRDGKEILSTPGTGELDAAVYCIYGRESGRMIKIDSRWEQYRVFGYVSKPTDARPSRNLQTFFVNDRPVRSKLLIAALEEAYRNQIMIGKFPACVLHLQLPANAVDVNVHPAKTEVKFLNEKAVFDCIHYGVLGGLNKTTDRPNVEFKTQPKTITRPQVQPPSTQKQAPFFQTMTPQEFKTFSGVIREAPKPAPSAASATAAKAMIERVDTKAVAEPISIPADAPKQQPVVHQPIPLPPLPDSFDTPKQQVIEMPDEIPWRMVGELYNTYIIVEQGEDAFLIDKHAAHERILFEKLKSNQEKISSQTLLSPVSCRLDPESIGALLSNVVLLETLGFGIEEFGDNTILIRQVPMDLSADDAKDTLESISADLRRGRIEEMTKVRDELLHTVACKAAIKAGWSTSKQELEKLAGIVMADESLKYCPHGRPICVTLSKKQLEKQFKRS